VRRSPVPVVFAAVALVAVSLARAAAQTPPPTPVPGPTLSPGRLAAQPCTIEGDDGPNTLTGTPGPDVICGHGGDDVLAGLDGDDVLEGGDGVDTATFEASPCCVRADLGAGTATGVGTDQLLEIENLIGTPGDDVLRGDIGPNALSGLGRTDLLYGNDGDDVLLGGNDDDFLAGEGGSNSLDGGTGANICAEGVGAACQPLSPGDGNDTRGLVDVRLVDTGGGPGTWRISWFGRTSKKRLWDLGYVIVSLDTREGPAFDFHLVARSTGRRMLGLLLRDGVRKPIGRVEARKPGARGVNLAVGLDRLALAPERAYYRWAVRTTWGDGKCRPCLDLVPGDGGAAFPRPLI
jgi:RTX calcium-binding nonapeptide repeat (4 copies)